MAAVTPPLGTIMERLLRLPLAVPSPGLTPRPIIPQALGTPTMPPRFGTPRPTSMLLPLTVSLWACVTVSL